jgi:hypothetical protein
LNQNINFQKQNFLNVVKNLSGNKLQQQDDLGYLINAAIEKNKLPVLEELSFSAKFSSSLFKILQRKDQINDETYFQKITAEFNNMIQEIKSKMEELLLGNEFMMNVFSEKYFQLTIQSLTKLNALCSDLNYVKLYFNDLKNTKMI